MRGVILIAPALLFGWLAINALLLLTEPASNAERQFALPRLAFTVPPFLWLFIFACRNFHRLAVSAGITANDAGVSLRIPVVPFVMAPYYAVRETFVPWNEVDRQFTPGRGARYFVASARPETEIPRAAFDRSRYVIDAAIAELLQRNDPPQRILAGSSPAILLTAGAVTVGLSAAAMIAMFDKAPALANFLAIPYILGLGLLAMGASPAKRVIIERRGIFLERGVALDFIPSTAYDSLGVESQDTRFGIFKSFTVTAVVEGKKVRLGFNQVFGFGFPIDEVRAAFSG